MVISVHAGHNPDGKVACGAAGIVKESTEARAITQVVIAKLRAAGHTVYDDTVNDGTSQNDVLKKIVEKCNSHNVDLVVSIHLNSGRNDYIGDGNIGGTEVYINNNSSKAKSYAEKIVSEMSGLGFRNRGVKTSSSLYVLKHTNAPALLFEALFVDDRDDCNLYQKVVVNGIADAIVKGLIGNVPASNVSVPTPAVFAAFEAVVTGSANVRNNPSMSGSVIGKAEKGQTVMVWGQEGEWYMVDSGKWIHNSLISKKEGAVTQSAQSAPVGTLPTPSQSAATGPQEAPAIMGVVTGNGVRVHSEPSANAPILSQVNKGAEVRIWKEENGWCMIDNGKWISAKYVQMKA